MSFAVLLSSVVRLAVALWALTLWQSLRDWRLAALAALIGLLAFKPIALLEVSADPWPPTFSLGQVDAFELLVSALCVAVIFLFGRTLREGRQARSAWRESESRFLDAAEASRLALDLSQAQLLEITAGIPGAVYQVVQGLEGDQHYTFVSEGIKTLTGLAPQELLQRPTAMMRVIDPEHVTTFKASVRQAMETLEPWLHDFRVVTPQGKKWLKGTANAHRRADGTLVWNGILLDITERKETETQLIQAQKMEAVGQLTGGVAHDFNNLLAIVLGNLELIEDRLDPNSKLRPFAETGLRAVERGAVLTQRLLAFSRRQALKPEPTDLNQLINDMLPMLHRALPESIDIRSILADELHRSLVDAPQLENALLNLAVNARDAMPSGGKLTIETSAMAFDDDSQTRFDEITAGKYVLLSVTDTGCGIPLEVIKRVFEPFFTTKEVGKGSGLGLSMVYGFVKQSGGHVRIYSEAGVGTTIKLFLPSIESATQRDAATSVVEELPSGGGEMVLVVEDDPDVRGLAVVFLNELGYRVLDAENGPSALTLLKGPEPIDLLLSDVVLPGGLQADKLAEQATRLRPSLKVMYMSGYAEGALLHHGTLRSGVELLNKPFRRADLARKVHQALEGDRSA